MSHGYLTTGDFEEPLLALLGKDAGGLSATTVGRLKEAWSEEHVYFWADGIHAQAGSKTPRSGCWSSSVPRPRARRSWSA